MSIIFDKRDKLEGYIKQKLELLLQLKTILLKKETLLENEELDLIESATGVEAQIINTVDLLDEQFFSSTDKQEKEMIRNGFKNILSDILTINDRILQKTKAKHDSYDKEMQKIGQARKLAQGNLGYINSYDQALQTSYYIDKKK